MISKETAPHYKWGQLCDGWRLVERPGVLSVIHERMPPTASEVRHYHRQSRQFFFVLAGVATMLVGDEVEHIPPQHGLEIAPGVPHQMRNESSEPLEFLVVSTPPAQGDRVVEPDVPQAFPPASGV